ncbi:hypothetical protein CVT26_004881 [Gymnopilus dilepis]|uniref:F-box domain-containing protein n=1 Tax=Gymnopilus dilepis TaxID=231916 RepID=A0A409W8D6_9AGAR|nr:hypothetical protein CVT26_004881 [Gymnopilus dilepis]
MSSSGLPVATVSFILSSDHTDESISNPEITLDMLPLDVHILILAHLPPRDIIAYRQVCRLFLRATQMKCVWMAALRRIAATQLFTELTYPMKRLTAKHLERLARLPRRLAKLIKHRNEEFIEPHEIRVLPACLIEADQSRLGIYTSGVVDSMYLAPGGRFLMTLSSDDVEFPDSTLFTMWDLGLNLQKGRPLLALARYLERMDELRLQLFFSDPEKIDTMWTISLERGLASTRILVHKVTLLPQIRISLFSWHEVPCSDPKTRFHVSLVPKTRNVVLSYNNNGKSYFRVWDFVQNQAALFVGLTSTGFEESSVFVYTDCILYAFEHRIMVYNLPQLQPLSRDTRLKEIRPALTVISPLESQNCFYVDYDRFSPLIPHLHSPTRLLAIDAFHLAILEVAESGLPKKKNFPNKVPILDDEDRDLVPITDARIFAALRGVYMDICDDKLFFLSLDHSSPSASLMDSKLKPDKDGKIDLGFVSTELRPPPGVAIASQTFSPLLCRHCILTPEGAVYILNY